MASEGKVVIIMGVSGSGKTTIGRLLAAELAWPFYDGDDFHPQTNVDKMSQGIALSDEDRASWLDAIHNLSAQLLAEGRCGVITCSALKRIYRERLMGNLQGVVFVYLKGTYDLAHQRLQSRVGHFVKTDLLPSQFETLEEPEGVLAVDTGRDPVVIVGRIRQDLGLSRP